MRWRLKSTKQHSDYKTWENDHIRSSDHISSSRWSWSRSSSSSYFYQKILAKYWGTPQVHIIRWTSILQWSTSWKLLQEVVIYHWSSSEPECGLPQMLLANVISLCRVMLERPEPGTDDSHQLRKAATEKWTTKVIENYFSQKWHEKALSKGVAAIQKTPWKYSCYAKND